MFAEGARPRVECLYSIFQYKSGSVEVEPAIFFVEFVGVGGGGVILLGKREGAGE